MEMVIANSKTLSFIQTPGYRIFLVFSVYFSGFLLKNQRQQERTREAKEEIRKERNEDRKKGRNEERKTRQTMKERKEERKAGRKQ